MPWHFKIHYHFQLQCNFCRTIQLFPIWKFHQANTNFVIRVFTRNRPRNNSSSRSNRNWPDWLRGWPSKNSIWSAIMTGWSYSLFRVEFLWYIEKPSHPAPGWRATSGRKVQLKALRTLRIEYMQKTVLLLSGGTCLFDSRIAFSLSLFTS